MATSNCAYQVTRLVAVVADLGLLLVLALAGDVAVLTAVVALDAAGALAAQVASLTTVVAGATTAARVGAALGAVARHVAGLATVVAGRAVVGRGIGAVAGEMAGLVALEAKLLSGGSSAVFADVALLLAVVADRLGALALDGLVTRFTTLVAGTERHFYFFM
ncbi:hypothetical protein BC940DRAFT_311689 [Gongronella butleri]|nr:hypothetical protein BC940DRAFT_311689 [Gongronella butleri]